jgi:hypothetical protein
VLAAEGAIRTMPKDLSALDAQRDSVIQWLNEGLTYEDVRRRLASQGVCVSERTLTSRIKRWGISRYNKRHRLDLALQARVAYYFHECQLTDEETVEHLAADGWKVNRRADAKAAGPAEKGAGRDVAGRALSAAPTASSQDRLTSRIDRL